MPFPLSQPSDIAERIRAAQETGVQRLRPDVPPTAIARAVRSEKGLINVVTGGYVPVAYETHLHLRWWGDQYFGDTAEEAQLIRHADMWGVYRRPATRAVGRVILTGVNGTVIPVNLQLRTPSGALVETSIGGTVVAGGSATVAVRALDAGEAANTAGGTRLALVTPLVGLDPQSGTLDPDGLAGGAAAEDIEELRARYIAKIREPGHGGNAFDYPKWVQEAFAATKVKTLPNWIGPGTVGVCVAMGTASAPRVPTPSEIDAIETHLGRPNQQTGLRPVTAEVVVVPVQLVPVALTLSVTPDSAPIRNAIASAFRLFLAREAQIGTPIPRSRLSEAISSASGEYSHNLVTPAADVAIGPRDLAVPGAIEWVPS